MHEILDKHLLQFLAARLLIVMSLNVFCNNTLTKQFNKTNLQPHLHEILFPIRPNFTSKFLLYQSI